MIRLAAVGDLHIGEDGSAGWRDALKPVSDDADLLLLAGDLTRVGTTGEAEAVAVALELVSIPIFAVLGNHDYHDGRAADLCRILAARGVRMLEGDAASIDVGDTRIGVAGSKGFGGGFANACGSDFGEPEMKAFIQHTSLLSQGLARALESLDADLRVALLHYSPIPTTLCGEHPQIYPFLGSHLLGDAIDAAGADLVLHGHAHAGSEKGITPGGVRVRNVAQPVIRSAYRVYCLNGRDGIDCSDHAGSRGQQAPEGRAQGKPSGAQRGKPSGAQRGKLSGAQRGKPSGAQRGEAERRSDRIAERRSDRIAERRSDRIAERSQTD